MAVLLIPHGRRVTPTDYERLIMICTEHDHRAGIEHNRYPYGSREWYNWRMYQLRMRAIADYLRQRRRGERGGWYRTWLQQRRERLRE